MTETGGNTTTKLPPIFWFVVLFMILSQCPQREIAQKGQAPDPDQPILRSDFDGDHKPDMAVWRPSNGTWYILLSSRDWNRDDPLIRQWGTAGDQPIINSDYDADGKADMAVWRPSDSTWYILLSSRDWNREDPLIRQWGNGR